MRPGLPRILGRRSGQKLRNYIRAYSKWAKRFRWIYTDASRRIVPNKIAGTS